MILVTGGAGYIGSHALVELASVGYDCVVLDNLCNSSEVSLVRVQAITGRRLIFVRGDIRDADLLEKLFADYPITSVVHFAGLKAVSESVSSPLMYYDNNVGGSQILLKAMAAAGVYRFIFSSSATVYGGSVEMPISEQCPVERPTNPYGRSKLMVEDILHDLVCSDSRWRVAILRYFNPGGAHESGLIGEDPNGVPNNLLPYISQVAVQKLPKLMVFGGDYDTHDGTGVRDYIHVVDLAKGHVAALRYLHSHKGIFTWNLGTGRGYSVLDVIKAFEKASGVKIPYQIVGRRDGDVPVCFSNPGKALSDLGWEAKLGLPQIMSDAWKWQKLNPGGYASHVNQLSTLVVNASY